MKTLFVIFFFCLFAAPVFSQRRLAPIRTQAEILNEKYCSGLFNTPEGQYFDMQDDHTAATAKGYLNILDWLRGRATSYQVYYGRNDVRVPYLRNQPAAVFVDEIRVSYDYLQQFPVSDIAMIKVMRGPFFGGWGGPGGAIAIYTFRGEEEEE